MTRRHLTHATAGPAPASLALVRWFAVQADRYQAGYLTVHPVNVARLRCDPAYGLKFFVAGYAYERSGAPRSYKTAAIKAVTAAGPHLEQIPAHYATFHPSPTNASLNPALDPRLADLNVPSLVAQVEQGALAEA